MLHKIYTFPKFPESDLLPEGLTVMCQLEATDKILSHFTFYTQICISPIARRRHKMSRFMSLATPSVIARIKC